LHWVRKDNTAPPTDCNQEFGPGQIMDTLKMMVIALMMEAVSTFETSVNFYQTTVIFILVAVST
jgi:hypothetical protein